MGRNDAEGAPALRAEAGGGVTFSTLEVVRLTGVTIKQLDYWARTGMLTPSADPGIGSGSRRRYAAADVLAARVLPEIIVATGAQVRTHAMCRAVVEAVRAAGIDCSRDLVLVVDGEIVTPVRIGPALALLFRERRRAVSVVCIGAMAATLRRQLPRKAVA